MSRKKYIEVILTPTQCKAARELLEWKQEDLSKYAKLGKATIGKFERKLSEPTVRTLVDIKSTFESAGIRFKNDDEGVGVNLINQESDQKE